MPRNYRGMDIFWWLQATGRLARTIHEVPDPGPRGGNRRCSWSAAHGTDGIDVDLVALQRRGVRLPAASTGSAARVARFAPDLAQTSPPPTSGCTGCSTRSTSTSRGPASPPRSCRPTDQGGSTLPAPTRPGEPPREGIGTVLVAAGYRPDYPWLRLPVTDPDGSIRQHQGVTLAPRVYVVGQRFQHRRDSGFIDGARHDARTRRRHLLTGCDPRRAALSRRSAA